MTSHAMTDTLQHWAVIDQPRKGAWSVYLCRHSYNPATCTYELVERELVEVFDSADAEDNRHRAYRKKCDLNNEPVGVIRK